MKIRSPEKFGDQILQDGQTIYIALPCFAKPCLSSLNIDKLPKPHPVLISSSKSPSPSSCTGFRSSLLKSYGCRVVFESLRRWSVGAPMHYSGEFTARVIYTIYKWHDWPSPEFRTNVRAPLSTSLFTLWGCLSSIDWGFKIHQLRCQLATYLCLYSIPEKSNDIDINKYHPTYPTIYIPHKSRQKMQLPSAL